MTKQMSIDEYELAELLKGEIAYANTAREVLNFDTPKETTTLFVELEYGDEETVTLEWEQGQMFYVHHSNADAIFENCSISVDEILDIVL